jgi:hypothetical protein
MVRQQADGGEEKCRRAGEQRDEERKAAARGSRGERQLVTRPQLAVHPHQEQESAQRGHVLQEMQQLQALLGGRMRQNGAP